MKDRKSISVIIGIVLAVMLIVTNSAPAFATPDPQEVAIKELTVSALEARWNTLTTGRISLDSFYEMSLPEAVADVSKIDADIRQHYLEPAASAGFQYTSVKVTPRFEKIVIDGNYAYVRVLADVEYTSQYPNTKEQILSKEADIPYDLELVQRGNAWMLVKFDAQDIYSKRANPEDVEAPPVSEWPDPNYHNSISVSSDVGILGFYLYYSRSGAASYAENWWNGYNPAYKTFTGNDCANFVSQSFLSGGSALLAWDAPYVWWYNTKGTSGTSDDTNSTSWSVAHDQAYNLSRNSDLYEHRGTYVTSATDLQVGDSIYYDWDGDGYLDHSAIVVVIQNGVPLVNYHSNPGWHKNWNLGAVTTRFLRVTNYYWIN